MGYLSVAFTPEERAKQLPKSGCTAAATVAMDALGGITVRIDTTPEGQGHDTNSRSRWYTRRNEVEKEQELFWERESHEPRLIFRWKKSNVA